MDPLCISLIQQHLDSINSPLAGQFKDEYQTAKIDVELDEVMTKWDEEQLARSLVHRYLEEASPALADEFKAKYRPLENDLQLEEVLVKWEEGQLARSLVFKHLKTVSPSLATEFQATPFPGQFFCSSEHQISNIQKEILSKMTKIGLGKNDENFGHRAPSKNSYKTFSTADIARIEKAIKDKEDIRKLATEIGRSFNSVYSKIYMLKKYSGLRKGTFSDDEVERVGLALEKH